VLSAFVAHTGWHWLTERGRLLTQYRFEWPVFDLAFLDLLLRWAMVAVALAAAAWLIFAVLKGDSHESWVRRRLRPLFRGVAPDSADDAVAGDGADQHRAQSL
jgi:hypothetical protein